MRTKHVLCDPDFKGFFFKVKGVVMFVPEYMVRSRSFDMSYAATLHKIPHKTINDEEFQINLGLLKSF